jgi:hypothetical protein
MSDYNAEMSFTAVYAAGVAAKVRPRLSISPQDVLRVRDARHVERSMMKLETVVEGRTVGGLPVLIVDNTGAVMAVAQSVSRPLMDAVSWTTRALDWNLSKGMRLACERERFSFPLPLFYPNDYVKTDHLWMLESLVGDRAFREKVAEYGRIDNRMIEQLFTESSLHFYLFEDQLSTFKPEEVGPDEYERLTAIQALKRFSVATLEQSVEKGSVPVG